MREDAQGVSAVVPRLRKPLRKRANSAPFDHELGRMVAPRDAQASSDGTPGVDFEPDPIGYTSMFATLDRAIHANLARFTLGLSPRAMASAYLDWLGGIAFSPGKQAQLLHKAQRKWLRLMTHAQTCLAAPESDTCCIEPLPQDNRFRDPAWKRLPFNFMYQSFLLSQQWWHNATSGVSGMSPQSERAVAFAARQWLDFFSPSNFLATNPLVLDRTLKTGCANLIEGAKLWAEDAQALIAGRGPVGADKFRVGVEIAATPGRVVYRNRLMELIQYAPSTKEVRKTPILIAPAWIMKYYVLDLSPHNSLVKYLVDRGHTVFLISWKNPGEGDRDLGLDDYRTLGPMTALDVIGEIIPDEPVHGVGYCLGGTLLAITAAAMARDNDERFKSLTFLATQVDFEEAGELMLFINEKQIAFLEDLMWEQGFLDSRQMAGAFQILRSNDLIWSKMVKQYLMGEREPMTDLMAWNADGTRMPYRMHAEYLEQIFLHNDLAEGRYKVGESPITLSDIRAPLFVVATETDHVAPWRSVYKFHTLTETEITFLLTNGGHNAGVVADPNDTWRKYRMKTHEAGARHVDPEHWLSDAELKHGSWWSAWENWLEARSGEKGPPPQMGVKRQARLAAAPGDYVYER